MALVYDEALKHPDWCPIQPADYWTELPHVVWTPLQRRLMDAMPGERMVPAALAIPGATIPRRLRASHVEWRPANAETAPSRSCWRQGAPVATPHGETRPRPRAVATVEQERDHAVITQVQGTFGAEDEEPEFTVRLLDYVVRSHALATVYPVPLPPGMEKDPMNAAMWCFSMFGNRALFATADLLDRHNPDRPLRTNSLLHIAVARGDVPAVERHLAAGVPIDLLAADGLAPLHWSLACSDPAVMALLLDRGSAVDVRSVEGATALMTAVQGTSVDRVCFLLDRGADVNARDGRGFTALHRAAEMGQLDMLRVLLKRGASPNPEAGGATPRSLAERRGHGEIVSVFDNYIAGT